MFSFTGYLRINQMNWVFNRCIEMKLIDFPFQIVQIWSQLLRTNGTFQLNKVDYNGIGQCFFSRWSVDGESNYSKLHIAHFVLQKTMNNCIFMNIFKMLSISFDAHHISRSANCWCHLVTH